MRRADFQFELPTELIAQRPLAERSDSRMLHVDVQARDFVDSAIAALVDWLRPGDLLVSNDTRVLPARLRGRKSTGGAVEVLLERLLAPDRARVQIRASKSPKPDSVLYVGESAELRVLGRSEQFFDVECADIERVFERWGEVPLPPYIERGVEDADQDRYQTVYARNPGSVAAPTAGLHFDDALLAAVDAKNVDRGYVTLHVGAGTFQPVRADDVCDHRMHKEQYFVSDQLAAAHQRTREAGGRVVAVGTTTVRCLESAYSEDRLKAGSGDTDIFIYPGVPVHSIDALLTNFHLPESTLIMMVSAIAGQGLIMDAYRHAVRERYRFFSYGDAMLIDRGKWQ